MKNKSGFTLVELVVAIAILGVLTLIALPTISAIQANNRKSKYVAYEKSIKAASKAYVDAFDEDLYGGTNYGCAIVKYSELKEKDLISDIQIKGEKCDNDNDTFMYVLKDKKGNFGYFSNIVCHKGSEVVYSHKDDNRTSCELEKGDPPKIQIIVKPDKEKYYIGDHPKVSIKISDEVGLKANQELDYVWVNVTTGKEITSKKTVKFENMHFKQRVTKDIEMPTEILNETMRDPTKYMVKVTGKVYDVNLNESKDVEPRIIDYFVGALLIKYKAGGAKMIDPHGAPYTVNASNDYVVRNGNDYNISKIRYKEENDLWDYNNKDYINIRKEHYHMVDKEEWKWGSKVFSQQKKLDVGDFGYTDEAIKKENKTVEVVANWKIDTFKLTYDDNGGKGCSDKGVTRDWNQKWNSNCTPKWDGHTFGGWEVDGQTLQPATISATSATKDYKAKAKWSDNYVNIYFKANTGTIDKTTTNGSRYSISNDYVYMDNKQLKYSIKYGDKLSSSGLPDNNSPTWLRLLKTGHHTDPASAWSKNADGSGGSFDQTKPLPASDFCDAKVSSCNVILYANWRKNQYTLTYDDKGGSGCSSQSLKKYYLEKWKPLCTPSRSGYTFGGWYDKDTKEKVDENTSATKNVTVEPKWTEIPKPPKYTLTYDDNGGTGCSDKSITRTKDEVWGTLCTPSRKGHKFNGWKAGSKAIDSTTPATESVEVKADWSKNACTITYYPNNGAFNSHANDNTQTCYYGSSCDLRNTDSYYYNATRKGYHIYSNEAAWSDGSKTFSQLENAGYKGENICSDLDKGNKTKNLYAYWSPNKCTITFDPGKGKFKKKTDDTTLIRYYNSDNIKNLRGPSTYYNATYSYYYAKPKAEWINGTLTYNAADGQNISPVDFCPKLETQDQSVTLTVNWTYTECQTANKIWHLDFKNNLTDIRKKIKNNGNSPTGIADVSTMKWKNPVKHCNASRPYRTYDCTHIICDCQIDKNTKKFCGSAKADDITSMSHANGVSTIYYKKTTAGKKTCEGTRGYNLNAHVYLVCVNGKVYEKADGDMVFHGYYFYYNSVGPYNNFSPTEYWTHSGGGYNDRVSSSSTSEKACEKACEYGGQWF